MVHSAPHLSTLAIHSLKPQATWIPAIGNIGWRSNLSPTGLENMYQSTNWAPSEGFVQRHIQQLMVCAFKMQHNPPEKVESNHGIEELVKLNISNTLNVRVALFPSLFAHTAFHPMYTQQIKNHNTQHQQILVTCKHHWAFTQYRERVQILIGQQLQQPRNQLIR